MTPMELLAQPSLVILAGLIAMWCSRRQPAAFRHWILVLAVVLAALQPAVRFFIPDFAVPVTLPAAEVTASSDGAANALTRFEVLGSTASAVDAQALRSLFVQVWIAGAVLGLSVLAVGIGWLYWQTRSGVTAGARWQESYARVAPQLGINNPVRLIETRHRTLLVTWGMRRPTILLPANASTWSDERIQLVLVHELSHVVRRDWLTQIVVEAARAVYWINPLFWIASARLRMECERACDDVVLGAGIDGGLYASHLVDLARTFRRGAWLPAPSMARPSTLERRVVAMLDPNLKRGRVPWARKCAAALVIVAAALPVAAASTRAGAPSGVLRDPSGRVLPAATVRLSAIGADAIFETQSDSTGSFQFPDVPDGDYMLSARLPGFLSARHRVQVSSAMRPLDVTLQVGTLKETITVRAGNEGGQSTTRARLMPAQPPCGTTDVGGNLKPPMKLKDVRPRYKTEWANAGVAGSVLLQAVIGTDGKVRNIEVVSPVNADLEEEAIAAVSQWEFSPTWLNCEAIEVRMFVTATFEITK